MELRTLHYFVAVSEALSFSSAAEKLKLSQSALSRQVQLLERELGVPLFDRAGRGISLTDAGRALLEQAYTIQNAVLQLKVRAAELALGTHGSIRIGATPQTLESLISMVLPRFQREHPKAQISLVEDGSANLAAAVKRGDIDVAVGSLARDQDLKSSALYRIQVLAALPRDHPLSRRKSIEIRELANEQVLLLRKDFMTRKLFDEACAAANIAPRILIESASPHCVLALAKSGLGVAIVPSTIRFAKSHPQVVPLHQDGRPLGIPLIVMWDPRRHIPPVVYRFVEQLCAYAKTRPAQTRPAQRA